MYHEVAVLDWSGHGGSDVAGSAAMDYRDALFNAVYAESHDSIGYGHSDFDALCLGNELSGNVPAGIIQLVHEREMILDHGVHHQLVHICIL